MSDCDPRRTALKGLKPHLESEAIIPLDAHKIMHSSEEDGSSCSQYTLNTRRSSHVLPRQIDADKIAVKVGRIFLYDSLG